MLINLQAVRAGAMGAGSKVVEARRSAVMAAWVRQLRGRSAPSMCREDVGYDVLTITSNVDETVSRHNLVCIVTKKTIKTDRFLARVRLRRTLVRGIAPRVFHLSLFRTTCVRRACAPSARWDGQSRQQGDGERRAGKCRPAEERFSYRLLLGAQARRTTRSTSRDRAPRRACPPPRAPADCGRPSRPSRTA